MKKEIRDGWMCRQWMDGWWMGGGWVDGWMGERLDKQMNGWLHGG